MNDYLNNLPVIHPREKLVYEAELKLHESICKILEDLTQGEYLRVLTNVFSECFSTIAKYSIRHERHGKGSDKPGGWE